MSILSDHQSLKPVPYQKTVTCIAIYHCLSPLPSAVALFIDKLREKWQMEHSLLMTHIVFLDKNREILVFETFTFDAGA